jgi:hypothetical protein
MQNALGRHVNSLAGTPQSIRDTQYDQIGIELLRTAENRMEQRQSQADRSATAPAVWNYAGGQVQQFISHRAGLLPLCASVADHARTGWLSNDFLDTQQVQLGAETLR